MTPAIVTIYHGSGPTRFWQTWMPGEPTAAVYRFTIPFANMSEDAIGQPAVLGDVWRDNNAVDGWELCVQADQRSLSVGDVAVIEHAQGIEAWAVAPIGWQKVAVMDLPEAPADLPRWLWMGRRATPVPV